MKTRRVIKKMTTRNQTKKPTNSTTQTKKSPRSSTKSSASQPKTPLSFPDLESVNQQSVFSENIDMNQSQPQPLNLTDSLNLNQKTTTGTPDVSAGTQRKLNAEEFKYAKLELDVKELLGSIAGILALAGSGMQNINLIADAVVVGKMTDPYSKSLVSLAQKYEWMYNGLNAICQTGVWGEAIAQTATIVVAIATVHGISMPEQVPGVIEGKTALQETTLAIQAQMAAQQAAQAA
jgi:hypothetical protein